MKTSTTRSSLRTLAILATGALFSAASAHAAVVYSTSFADLSGWSTFGSPAAVGLDAATDNRTVFFNNSPGTETAIIQRGFTLTSLSDTPTVSWTLRRAEAYYGLARVSLFQQLANPHAAGDVQNIDIFFLATSGNLQFNTTRFDNNFDGTTTTTTPYSAALSGGALPLNNLASDYVTFTLAMNTTGNWSITTSRGDTPINLSLGASGGAFDSTRLDLGDNEASSTFLMDSYSIDAIPEPSTWALLALSMTTVIVLRRRRNIQNS